MSKVLLVKVIAALQTRTELCGELVTGVGLPPCWGSWGNAPRSLYEFRR